MNIGVVGCGYWGPNLVRNLIETNRCQQAFCYDISARALAKLMTRFPSVKIAGSLAEMIDCCDAVMVATPVKTHYDIAKRILMARKPVFVEKPLTDCSEEAAELVALSEERNLTLMVGHTFLYSPPVKKIKQYISSGALGEIFFLSSSRVNLGLHRSDVNVIWDLAPHDISMLIYWLGNSPIQVSAFGRACIGSMVDIATLNCVFRCGTVASLEVSWLAPSKLRRTVVVGSRKMVVYDDTLSAEKIKLYDRGANVSQAPASFGEYQLTYREGDLVSPYLENTEPLLTQVNQFLDSVENKVRPQSDGYFGLEVVRVAEAACYSMKQNGRPTDVGASARGPRMTGGLVPAAAAAIGAD